MRSLWYCESLATSDYIIPGDTLQLKTKLKNACINVEIPTMSDTDHLFVQSGLPAFSKAVGKTSEDDNPIGHSVGCAPVLRFLEFISYEKMIKSFPSVYTPTFRLRFVILKM